MAALLQLATERRSDRRYPVNVAIKYRLVLADSLVRTGIGTLVDMSSSGVLFQTAEFLPRGAAIELFIAWPTKLNDSDGLDLWVNGTTVRTNGNSTGVEICESEFRIRETRATLSDLCHA